MHFKTVAIVGRYQDSGLDAPIRSLAKTLVNTGCSVLLEATTAQNAGITEFPIGDYAQIGERADLAIVMGGDGTMIGAARELAHSKVPLIGINHGRLGFITDIPLDDANDALLRVLKGEYDIEERSMLEGRVVLGDGVRIGPYRVDPAARSVDGRRYDLILVFYGWEPQAGFADSLQLARDARGYIRTDFATAETSVPDIYAVGEVANRMHPCVVTSLADGVVAAKAIQRRWERA